MTRRLGIYNVMAIELKVPEVGESITEVEIGLWLKKEGESVLKDEAVVTLESDKATVELPAPEAGTMGRILKRKGETAKVGEVIGYLDKAAKAADRAVEVSSGVQKPAAPIVMPAAQLLLDQHGIRASDVQPTGPGGRVLKEDVLRHIEADQAVKKHSPSSGPVDDSVPFPERSSLEASQADSTEMGREEEVVPMSRLRRTVAERLVQAQHEAALLTTFNEVDMSGVIALRKQHGENFQQKYRVKLGFMSFFVKACIDALKQFPAINAEIRGSDVVYHNYFDIGVAVGGGKGLVVPVLRNAERMSFAEIEMAVGDFSTRARENKLKVDELQGGTFTISNGGVFGSLLSTPIVNPPQSGVLGMHAIQERPVAREGVVVIRPMMYVALTYDHRLVDGREAVSFLKRVKDVIETPARMLMEV